VAIDTYKSWVEPGHYFSPVPSKADIVSGPTTYVAPHTHLKLRGPSYTDLLQDMAGNYYPTLDLPETKTPNSLYYYKNDKYSYGDAITLGYMISDYQPKRIIEIGSGFSTTVMLEETKNYEYPPEIICIEPYPNTLNDLVPKDYPRRPTLLEQKLQDVPISTFSSLRENDILFVDSSHVSKYNSDVNRIFFEILPNLRSGVLVHFHDIFFPFEYPKAWLEKGIYWTEAYMLRAFLQYNEEFQVIFWSSLVEDNPFMNVYVKEHMPLFAKNFGANFWMVRR
jgi:predicted O-methyltransferase YrrM